MDSTLCSNHISCVLISVFVESEFKFLFCCFFQVEEDGDGGDGDGDGGDDEPKPGKCKSSGLVPSPKVCMLLAQLTVLQYQEYMCTVIYALQCTVHAYLTMCTHPYTYHLHSVTSFILHHTIFVLLVTVGGSKGQSSDVSHTNLDTALIL